MTQEVEPNADTQAAADGKRPYKINVLDRVVGILEAFARRGSNLSLSEIAQETDLHVSTCLRLLSNLQFHGLVTKEEDSGRYRLGYRFLALAEVARGQSGLVETARPIMRDLSRKFNETVVFSVRSGDFRIDLEQIVGLQAVRRVVTLGIEKPLYAGAASRVLLSGMSEVELDRYLARVKLKKLATRTITDVQVLKASLVDIRTQGYAKSVQEQFDDSGGGIVAPVYGVRGEVAAALGISVPQFRFSEALQELLVPEVLKAASQVSDAISGKKS
ncbi:IclR family transcriptional regulator [Mariluticola halotolerans]|uniref:IclR family transcriptional regulator n=1 Tax=Mariluticola halotolerans TaxID=2909283 RepID=UPI0026E37365|nr:IclR family transcriptional regulator [Mariluticola halotolerans]UJQ93362.1 IclR family transcriptional regulator [Mariluticola halotolerans]